VIRKIIGHYVPKLKDDDKICCPLPKHRDRSPSLNIYDESHSWYCFGCAAGGDGINFIMEKEGIEFSEAKEKAMEILDISFEEYCEEKKRVSEENVAVDCHPELDRNVSIELIKNTGYIANGYRGIKDEYNRFFGHLTKLDENGVVKARYYPETNIKGKIAGWKCRNHPKDFTFGLIGNTGSKNQLSGQVKFNSGGKYLLIVGGEEDKVAAYQMLAENRTNKDFDPIAVVSPTAGENSAAKQVASQYTFCDAYEFIYIGTDNDDAGRKAALAIAAVLPKEKVMLVTWSGKDPNKMLQDGKEKQFCRDFYNAKPLVASGIAESTGLMDQVREELMRPRIPLPPEWLPLQEAMKGGIRQGSIVNIIGDTSVGKSTLVNALNYFWMFNAPEKVGVASLEATSGQYTLDMLSLHLEKNLVWMGEGTNILEYLERPDVIEQYDNLLTDEYGQPRFSILDERDGNIKMLERQIDKLVNQHGCKIIVIDVLTDILRGTNGEMQENHMLWQKQMVKTGVTIVNVLHTRKPQNSEGGWRKASEYDALGSGTFVQSAAYNIVVSRDKMNNDVLIRNTTHVDMPKCRGGITGEIMKLIYDSETRTQLNETNYNLKKYGDPVIQQENPPAYHSEEPEF